MYARKPATMFFIWVLVLAFAHTLAAQSGVGSVQGTVTDVSGAVIPAAAANVVNVATDVVTDTKSNGVGFYLVPGLFTGTYQITVTAPGMKTYTTSIELLVAQNAVVNPALTVGEVTEKVKLRVDMDAFNVQGYNNPGADGVEQVQPGGGQASSYNTPRQIQLTMRLSF
jgi:hypothetical protein